MKRIFIAVFVMLAVSVSLGAQGYFKPFASFRVIETERFSIVFPRESEATARMLAGFADEVYAEVSALLESDVPFRIPVVLNPHQERFNGFYQPITPHVMLFDTAMDIEWTTFSDSLRYLFVHELTHAVSMNVRGRGVENWRRVFGAFFTPAIVTPMFMIEGVTVSFESRSSFGRVNDPLARHTLRQAAHEGKFLSPIQSTSLYDLPVNGGGMFYEYGGFFSAWLQENYGMELYARLWRGIGGDREAVGTGVAFRNIFSPYKTGFYHIFREVYGIDFLDAWAMFAESVTIDGVEENRADVLPGRKRFLAERERFVDAIVARGGKIFALNAEEGKVHVLDAATGATREVGIGGIRSSYDLDVSPDGSRMLVSGFRREGDRLLAASVEIRGSGGLATGRSFAGLGRARYFRDGVVGLAADRHDTLLVFEDSRGERKVLLRGNRELLFSGPQPVDDERIAFVVSRSGLRELWLYEYPSGTVSRIETDGGIADGDGGDADREGEDGTGDAAGAGDPWGQMRGLGVSEGRLLFAHNSGDRMYRLGIVDLDRMTAVFNERDFSGGVFNPVSSDGEIYYRAAFSSTDRLLRFPESIPSVSGVTQSVRLARLEGPGFAPGTDHPMPDLPRPPTFDTSRYFGIRYMNPFAAWFPSLLLGIRGTGDDAMSAINGVGLTSVMRDPTNRNIVTLTAHADFFHQMLNVPTLSWQNHYLGVPLELSFYDQVLPVAETMYRATRVGLSLGPTWTAGSWGVGFAVGGSYLAIAKDNGASSAYEWGRFRDIFDLSAGLSLSNIRARPSDVFGTGTSLNLVAANPANYLEPYSAALLRASTESTFPLRLSLYGAYSAGGMDLYGVSLLWNEPIFAGIAPNEYGNPYGLELNWLSGGEAAIGLFSWEIQGNLSHLYFRRIFGVLALRNTFFDSAGHPDAEGLVVQGDIRAIQSLVFTLSTQFTAQLIGGTLLRIGLEPSVWGAWKISNTVAGKDPASQWKIGFGFNLRL